MDEFQNISAKSIEINQNAINNNGITTDALEEIKAMFQQIEINISKKDKDALNSFLRLITILGFILTLMSEIRNWIPKENYATKEQIENLFQENYKNVELLLKKNNEYKITNRVSKIMIKPNLSSYQINSLPPNFHLIVL